MLPNLEPDRVCVGGEGRRKDPGGQLAGPPAPQGARQADQGNIFMQFLHIIYKTILQCIQLHIALF